MNESFDLSFFGYKTMDIQRTKIHMEKFFGVNELCVVPPQKSRFRLLNEKEICFEYYEEENFVEYWLGIGDIRITPNNFQTVLNDLLMVVAECFSRFPSIQFATGIYELTAYYLGDITNYDEFNRDLLCKFPFLFLREKNQFGFSSKDKFHNVWWIVNQGVDVQNIFEEE